MHHLDAWSQMRLTLCSIPWGFGNLLTQAANLYSSLFHLPHKLCATFPPVYVRRTIKALLLDTWACNGRVERVLAAALSKRSSPGPVWSCNPRCRDAPTGRPAQAEQGVMNGDDAASRCFKPVVTWDSQVGVAAQGPVALCGGLHGAGPEMCVWLTLAPGQGLHGSCFWQGAIQRHASCAVHAAAFDLPSGQHTQGQPPGTCKLLQPPSRPATKHLR